MSYIKVSKMYLLRSVQCFMMETIGVPYHGDFAWPVAFLFDSFGSSVKKKQSWFNGVKYFLDIIYN